MAADSKKQKKKIHNYPVFSPFFFFFVHLSYIIERGGWKILGNFGKTNLTSGEHEGDSLA